MTHGGDEVPRQNGDGDAESEAGAEAGAGAGAKPAHPPEGAGEIEDAGHPSGGGSGGSGASGASGWGAGLSSDPAGRFEVHGTRQLRAPVLVVALEGWVDAGLGAATAVAAVQSASRTELLVGFDGERFLDQRARRPTVRIVNGVTRELRWPRTEIRAGADRDGNDMLFLVGPEPDFHWKEFVDAVVGLSLHWGVRMMVGMGAFPAPAPHTRPVKLAATAPEESQDYVARVGIVAGELEVPAGVLAALEMGFGAAGIDAVSLWARVPHYVAAMPFPEASAALVDGLAAVAELSLDSSTLRVAADSTRREVDEEIARNPDHMALLRKLEESIDASEGNALGVDEVPSGDEIAAELGRFLRGES